MQEMGLVIRPARKGRCRYPHPRDPGGRAVAFGRSRGV